LKSIIKGRKATLTDASGNVTTLTKSATLRVRR
jgi:hypothetical protein